MPVPSSPEPTPALTLRALRTPRSTRRVDQSWKQRIDFSPALKAARGGHAMSTVEYNIDLGGFQTPPVIPPVSTTSSTTKCLHRIGQVRQEQGVSVRSVARRLGLSMQDVRAQEQPASDLRLSQVHQWQHVLEVPLADLLLDSEGPLSAPVSQRARMLRVMKTAKALAGIDDRGAGAAAGLDAHQPARRGDAGTAGGVGVALCGPAAHAGRDGPDRRADDPR